jgi:hypothetical protein
MDSFRVVSSRYWSPLICSCMKLQMMISSFCSYGHISVRTIQNSELDTAKSIPTVSSNTLRHWLAGSLASGPVHPQADSFQVLRWAD